MTLLSVLASKVFKRGSKKVVLPKKSQTLKTVNYP